MAKSVADYRPETSVKSSLTVNLDGKVAVIFNPIEKARMVTASIRKFSYANNGADKTRMIINAYGLELSHKQLELLIKKRGKEILAKMDEIQKEIGVGGGEPGNDSGATSTET